MENKKSNVWMYVAVVAIVIIGIIVFYRNKNATPGTATNDTTLVAPASGPESVQDTTGQTSGIGAVPISYANALVKYADRRIQLDSQCQAHPSYVTYKDNTGIMIDNRSPYPRTIKVGTTFTIKAYGFKIVTLPDIYLSAKTLLVDCDHNQNVATIIVQE